MALADTANLAVRLTLDDRQFTGSIKRIQSGLGGLNRNFGQMGRGVGQLGTGLARAGVQLGALAVVGFGAAAKAAIDFEDAFAGVKKTVSEADLAKAGLSFDSLERTFRDMALEVPIAATEFARIGEVAGALGVGAADIDDFVKTAALLGVTTNLSADEAADSLGRIGAILKFTGRDYQDFADVLVALGNQGASTESEIIEITKRFAPVAQAAGLATDQIAALSSVVATLANPELGASALSRLFGNLGKEISISSKKGEAFADFIGKSLPNLKQAINKGQGLPLFLDFLEKFRTLSPVGQNKILDAIGINRQSDIAIFRNFAERLPELREQLDLAANATGALSAEAQKRFNTVASKIGLFRNAITEVGITIGEGMLPAIGRATDKLREFLLEPKNIAELQKLGSSVGRALDKINWENVLKGAKEFGGILKGALGFAVKILQALDKLPTEIKAAALGFLTLNKLSGGLIGAGVGNIVGGAAGGISNLLARGLFSKVPVLGALAAQPVFVTNWPLGGLGGLGGAAAGGGGLLGKAGRLFGTFILPLGIGFLLAEAIREATGVPKVAGVPLRQAIAAKGLGALGAAAIAAATAPTGLALKALEAKAQAQRDAIESSKLAMGAQMGQTRGTISTGNAAIVSAIRSSVPTVLVTVNTYGGGSSASVGTVIRRGGGQGLSEPGRRDPL